MFILFGNIVQFKACVFKLRTQMLRVCAFQAQCSAAEAFGFRDETAERPWMAKSEPQQCLHIRRLQVIGTTLVSS